MTRHLPPDVHTGATIEYRLIGVLQVDVSHNCDILIFESPNRGKSTYVKQPSYEAE